MEADLGNLGLHALTVITLLFVSQKVVKGIETLRSIGNGRTLLQLEFVRFHAQASAIIANAAHGLEDDGDKALMVDWSSQLQVSKVSWI